ncbi:MAG TPA: hypothetical protein PKD85_00130 [Saprospiraceae bacterium]|nr:hypothetical protein [Saprospiraceae bacterium]
MGLKERLTELFGVPVTVPTLHFYKIKNRAPVFRKKRNTNINLNFKFTYSRVTELESIVSLVVSLRGLTYFLRKNYRLHTGYFVQLLGNSLIITFINPFLAYNFLKYCSGEQPLEMSVDDQVIVTVRLYSKHKFILRSLLFLLKT